MTEVHRGYQTLLRERSGDFLPFVDDVLVRRTARAIINTAVSVPFDHPINFFLPYSVSPEEETLILGRLRRNHKIIARNTQFLPSEVEAEGKKVLGTEVIIAKRIVI